ncbi:MAG: asparagine synthetase A [Candidatus Methanodesulfokora sp.]
MQIQMQREDIIPILRIQTTVLREMVNFMVDRGFIQLLPVITSKVTDPLGPDPGSSVVTIPKIKYYDEELVLTQSMILHKQLAVAKGLERIFIMSPNVRLEDKRRKDTGRHLFEFTQMDFEMAGAGMRDVFSLVEDLIIHIIKAVKSENEEELEELGREIKIPQKPFPVYTTHELEERYGKDWEINASADHNEPFWAVCFKREFYDREDPDMPGHFRNYDLIYPEGFGEALSGGEREWRYERIVERIRRDGLDEKFFSPYLEMAKQGILIPSAGAGIGVERLIRFLSGKKHVGDVQLFRRVPGEPILF